MNPISPICLFVHSAIFNLHNILSSLYDADCKPSKKEIVNVLKRRENLVLYLSMFLIFFIFQAVLNFIPFELQKIDGDFQGTKTGLLYAGYAIGVIVSLNAFRIIKFFKGESKSMLIGSIIFLFGIQFFH